MELKELRRTVEEMIENGFRKKGLTIGHVIAYTKSKKEA